ncbi:S8 family serine peptidase [Crassaminicella thermophila]|uniref:S8 family serine peptidase n=1 Tax=Crassaminicella thermophila TaxID=2599308 RepID=A0A5C0SAV4_CRATE|nr:S8 family serine peptidase [Crassaminicella thermophila]QEK11705.1 S8 family serine peptidase [Crassaminicella thermophila]
MKKQHNNLFEILNITGRKTFWSQGFFGQDVKVAIIDTGINTQHQEFKNVKIKCKNVINDNVEPGMHGTATAGCLVYVAPNVEILNLEINDEKNEAYNDNIAKAIRKAVDEDCDIINLSYSHKSNYGGIEEACQYAYDNDVLIVCSMSNEGKKLRKYPACFDTVLSVGAIDWNEKRCDFSNYGQWIDVVQVGKNIPVPHYKYNDEYLVLDGTSFSTPLVAGIAALIKCKYKTLGKYLSMQEFMNLLTVAFSKDLGELGFDKYYGFGLCSLQPLVDTKEFTIGSNMMKQNREVIKMEAVAKIESGRTLVPLRYVNNNACVLWIPEEKKVKIMY